MYSKDIMNCNQMCIWMVGGPSSLDMYLQHNHGIKAFLHIQFELLYKALLYSFLHSLYYIRRYYILWNRWVSVVEFHDPTLGIGKIFGQESTVVKWNYQILSLHQVTVHQKLGVILVIKWFKNWSQQKMLFTKKVRLNWYSSMKFF